MILPFIYRKKVMVKIDAPPGLRKGGGIVETIFSITLYKIIETEKVSFFKGGFMKKVSLSLLSILAVVGIAFAQTKDTTAAETNQTTASADEKITNLKGEVDGLSESYAETKSTVAALSKIKVSGYIQAQYLVNDVMNVLSLNGVKSPYVRQAFLIKRGRLKTTYDAGLCQYVLEIDVTQDGVGMKDAYASFKEPWMKALSLTVGSMDRPFGYEVSYSSSMLESPERSKMIGYLFPKEKDLGAMLEFAQEEGPLSFLNVKAGVYNGMTNILNEDNDYKDIIGRIGFKAPFQEIGLDIDGGVSGYKGLMTDVDTTTGGRAYSMDASNHQWDLTTGQKGKTFDRQYFGADLQLFYATPVIGGTCVKGEYVQGKHPTKAGADDFYSITVAPPTSDALFNREIMGYYAYFIQNIDPANLQLVVKYDFWDPNTTISATDFTNANTSLTAGAALTAGDIAYSTLGLGLLYYLPWAQNIRCMLFYEMPKNEKLTNVTNGTLAKYANNNTSATNLNLLTARVQVKF
jgi:hypothetical protein